jgi:hypothetical protein
MSRQRSRSYSSRSPINFADDLDFDETTSLFTRQTTIETVTTSDDEISYLSNNQFFDFDPFGDENSTSPTHSWNQSPSTSVKLKPPAKRVTFHESVFTSSTDSSIDVLSKEVSEKRDNPILQLDLDKKSHGQSATLHSTNDIDDLVIPSSDKNPPSIMRKLYLTTMKRLGVKKYSTIGDGNKQTNLGDDGKADEENTIMFMEESLYTFEAPYDSLHDTD